MSSRYRITTNGIEYCVEKAFYWWPPFSWLFGKEPIWYIMCEGAHGGHQMIYTSLKEAQERLDEYQRLEARETRCWKEVIQ